MKINYDIDGELSLLGTCLILRDKLYLACQALKPEYFFLSSNQEIFRLILELYAEASEVNLETLVAKATVKEKLDLISQDLAKLKPLAAVGRFNANMKNILENYAKSRIAHFVKEVSENFEESSIQKIQLICDEYHNSSASVPTYTAKDLFDGKFYDSKNMYEWLLERKKDYSEGKLVSGITTGFGQLDMAINGMYKPAYIILGGIPGSGKTTFALQMLKHVVNNGHKAAFITLEMIREQSSLKILSDEIGVPYSNLARGNFTDEVALKALNAIKTLKLNKNLFLQDMQVQNLSSLRARIKQLVEVYGIEVLFIDYLTLINNPSRGVNMHEKILEISSTIRSLLIELKIPGVILCQLNRGSTETAEAPKAHHLFGSSQIEKDASEILMLHPMSDGTDQRRLYVRKSRYGPRDYMIKFSFEDGKFEEIPFGGESWN